MATPLQQRFGAANSGQAAVVIDQALRAYLLKVYNLMASGLLLSGAVAALVARSPEAMAAVFGSGLGMVVALAPLGILLVMSFGRDKMSAATMNILYWVFVSTFGVSLASIFHVYTGDSILRVFFITAGTFGAVSLYGYTTTRDLSGFGTYLFMGLIGLIIASVVNIFLGSSLLQFGVSVLGVLIFTGLTAYDTQRIKRDFYESDPSEVQSKKAIFGAVSLYLDFLNLFMMLLHLLGGRRS
jgi:FtsH-binding integral membrane protein